MHLSFQQLAESREFYRFGLFSDGLLTCTYDSASAESVQSKLGTNLILVCHHCCCNLQQVNVAKADGFIAGQGITCRLLQEATKVWKLLKC
jgi:hypothetical protein